MSTTYKLLYNRFYVIDTTKSGTTRNIYVGGKNIQCVYIYVTSATDALLDTVAHDNMCQDVNMTLPEDKRNYLPRGELGTVTMVLLAMNYVLKHYKHVTRFVLDDKSKRLCDDSGSKIHNMLFHYCVAFYGMTWYENKFGATLEGTAKESYDTYIKRLNSVEIKSSITNPFTDNRLLFSLFESSTKLNEFFKKLRDQYTDKNDEKHHEELQSELCILCSTWLEQFVDYHIFEGRSREFLNRWYITLSSDTIVKMSEKYILTSGQIQLDADPNNEKVIEDTRDLSIKLKKVNFLHMENIDYLLNFKNKIETYKNLDRNKVTQVYLRTMNGGDIHLGDLGNYKKNRELYLESVDNNSIQLGQLIFRDE
jgi:hypothetical protein